MIGRSSYCTTLALVFAVTGGGGGEGAGRKLAKCVEVYVKVFYVVGKALSGELSCTRKGLGGKFCRYKFCYLLFDPSATMTGCLWLIS